MYEIKNLEAVCQTCGKQFTCHTAQYILGQYNDEHECYHCKTKRTRAITKHQEGIHAKI